MSNINDQLLEMNAVEIQPTQFQKGANSPSRSPEANKPVVCGDYELDEIIGGGSFGHVYSCRNINTGKHYAVKQFKTKFSTKKKAYDQREIRILQRFDEIERRKSGAHCPYVMKADHIDFDNRKLYVFFQPMDMNLTQFIKKRFKRGKGRLDETNEIKVITRQILLGMKYLNEELGILHRDLKPDNIMINENPLCIKIIDFGTCKDLSVETGPHTSYVSTRWYRAPECVLRSHHYNFNSDIFAVGCVMAEMYLGHPLFPGTSELDQIDRIFQVLGTPRKDQWREGYKLAERRDIAFTEYPKKNLMKYLHNISDEAHEAIKLMLKISSQKRCNAIEALEQPFLADDQTPSTQDSTNIQFNSPAQLQKQLRLRNASEIRPIGQSKQQIQGVINLTTTNQSVLNDNSTVSKNSDSNTNNKQDKMSFRIEQIDNDMLDTLVPQIQAGNPGVMRHQQSESGRKDNQISPQQHIVAFSSSLSNNNQRGHRYKQNKHLNYNSGVPSEGGQLPQISINVAGNSLYGSPTSGVNSALRSTIYKNIYNNAQSNSSLSPQNAQLNYANSSQSSIAPPIQILNNTSHKNGVSTRQNFYQRSFYQSFAQKNPQMAGVAGTHNIRNNQGGAAGTQLQSFSGSHSNTKPKPANLNSTIGQFVPNGVRNLNHQQQSQVNLKYQSIKSGRNSDVNIHKSMPKQVSFPGQKAAPGVVQQKYYTKLSNNLMVDANSTFMVPTGDRNRSGIGGMIGTLNGQQNMFNVTLHRNNNLSVTNQNSGSSKLIRKMAPEEMKNASGSPPNELAQIISGMTIQDNTFYSPKVGQRDGAGFFNPTISPQAIRFKSPPPGALVKGMNSNTHAASSGTSLNQTLYTKNNLPIINKKNSVSLNKKIISKLEQSNFKLQIINSKKLRS